MSSIENLFSQCFCGSFGMMLNERLRTIRETLNLTQKSFAKSIFISTSYYANIESGQRQVLDKTIDSICKVYNANKEWILTGQGEIFNTKPPDVRLQELIDIYKRLNPYFQGYIIDHIRNLEKIQDNEKK
jgi:transcriptional regulator with XRE-family HTH domain